MLGSTPITAILGSGVDSTDHEAMRAFVRAACGEGLSLLLVLPNSKQAADMRTVRQRRADDKIAQEQAKAEGRRAWEQVKSPSGLALASNDAKTVLKYLDRYVESFSEWGDVNAGGMVCVTGVPFDAKRAKAGEIVITKPVAVNLAVEVGASGLVVVDCDTREQLMRFLNVSEAPPDMPPTVQSPGQMNAEGVWVHKDGGHFWFTVPDEVLPVLPRNSGALTWGGDHGFAVLWDRRYVLIPPSVRPEGAYELTGRDYPLPEWLAVAIMDHGAARYERYQANRDAGSDSDDALSAAIDTWAESIGWADILEPLGWTPAPRSDGCGCAVWSAPGLHASPKSATAHDSGCSLGRYTEVNCPLHIWTDHPGEPFDRWLADEKTSTLSKLQAVSLVDYGGNIGKAMDALGLAPDLGIGADLGVGPASAIGDDQDVSMGNLRQEIEAAIVDELPDGTPVIDGGEWPASESPAHHEVEAARDHTSDDPDSCSGCDARVDERHTGDCPVWLAQIRASRDAEEKLGTGAPSTDLFDMAGAPVQRKTPPTSDGVGTDQNNPFADRVSTPDPDVFESGISGVPRIAPFSHWRDLPPPEYVIDGLIEHGGLSCIIGPPGVGKALSLDTPLPTPTGWTTMGDVQPGDLLLGRDGLPTAVRAATGVMFGRPCYEVEFSDGSMIVADAQHQWRTSSRHQRSPKSQAAQGGRIVDSIRTTKQIFETLRIEENRINHSIATSAALQMQDADLLIAPYTMGAWLGDGTSASNGFTSADPELVDRIRLDGYQVKHHDMYRYSIFTPHNQVDGPQPREDTFTALLRKAGVLNNKHIPASYLRASEAQRRALLAGLLDTDGTASNGSAQLCTTRQALMEGAYELIVSLGYRCHITSKVVAGRTSLSSVAWTLMFAAGDQPVFELARKADKMTTSRDGRSSIRTRIRFITDVRSIKSVPVRCVEVNNDEHMYLAGRSMIPTHNSTVALDMACHIATGRRWQGRQTLKTKVMYMPGEGLSGAIQRLIAWCDARGIDESDLSENLLLADSILQLGAKNEAWAEFGAYVARQKVGLIIFDTFARMSLRLEENSATDVGLAVARFGAVQKLTNAGVLVVHHTAKGQDFARGSSALNGAMDSELLVKHGDWDYSQLLDSDGKLSGKPIQLSTSKQKNAEQLDEPLPLMITTHHIADSDDVTAALITGPNGDIDPLSGDLVLARPVAEPIVETAIRVREVVDKLPRQGASRSELVIAVRPDAYALSRSDAGPYWKLRIGEAVDRAMRYDLIETLTGTPSGGRYIPSTGTVEDARQRAAAEVINQDDQNGD